MMPAKTDWTLYATNEELWLSLLKDCASAKESIDLEQFIFVADDFGKRLIDICAERAAAGVKVRFLWDAAGSFTFWGSNIAEDLRKKNIELRFWKTLIPSYFKLPDYRSWFLRNHRRTVVIDGEVGYTGSICVQDHMRNWRDINVRLDGPVVSEMQNAFGRMWARSARGNPIPRKKSADDPEFQYATNYPAPGRRHLYHELVRALRRAKRYVYITTPYFVPTPRLVHAIKHAAHGGADVRLIIPERSDYYAVDLGARSFFTTLMEAGVRIFLYRGNMIHGKATVIDDNWATVGSMNLDQISLLYNFEANIISTNTRFAEELASHFVHDMHDSVEVSLNEWRNRFFIEKIPEILIRLVRAFL